MMANIVKMNDTTVAQIREVRSIHGKTELVQRKAMLEAQLAEVNELLAVFTE